MDHKRIVIAQYKEKAEKLRAELAEVETVIRALGGSSAAPAAAAPKKKAKAKTKPLTDEQKGRRLLAIQKAQDALAVKRGTATPEQIARHKENVAAKAQADPHARAVARQSPGASLREAAAG